MDAKRSQDQETRCEQILTGYLTDGTFVIHPVMYAPEIVSWNFGELGDVRLNQTYWRLRLPELDEDLRRVLAA